jgi:hypothetical protein
MDTHIAIFWGASWVTVIVYTEGAVVVCSQWEYFQERFVRETAHQNRGLSHRPQEQPVQQGVLRDRQEVGSRELSGR